MNWYINLILMLFLKRIYLDVYLHLKFIYLITIIVADFAELNITWHQVSTLKYTDRYIIHYDL